MTFLIIPIISPVLILTSSRCQYVYLVLEEGDPGLEENNNSGVVVVFGGFDCDVKLVL